MRYETNSAKKTYSLGLSFGSQIKKGDIIAFKGGMGMGKTTFTKGVAKALGYNGDVQSPTFAIVNEYQGDNITLYHFDMYRITSLEDLFSSGFYDYLDDENAAIIIEWSENITDELNESTIWVEIDADLSDNNILEKRTITIKGDDRFENLSYWNISKNLFCLHIKQRKAYLSILSWWRLKA